MKEPLCAWDYLPIQITLCMLHVCTPACFWYIHACAHVLIWVHECVCVCVGLGGGASLMSSCSCSLPLVLHPSSLFCALAEVSAVLFNPAGLIPITFHLLHSTAPVPLHACSTQYLTETRNTDLNTQHTGPILQTASSVPFYSVFFLKTNRSFVPMRQLN